ncbi:MAG: LuxR C-terminal-related transcriptional regulator [Chloroflexi bacterium]|nr:LuxR C-terminal-related transcriptional regulator [Chloroflexota bacterium]
MSNQAMARSLALSEKTIEFHLKNLRAKLQVNSRVAAALWAKAHGLLAAP